MLETTDVQFFTNVQLDILVKDVDSCLAGISDSFTFSRGTSFVSVHSPYKAGSHATLWHPDGAIGVPKSKLQHFMNTPFKARKALMHWGIGKPTDFLGLNGSPIVVPEKATCALVDYACIHRTPKYNGERTFKRLIIPTGFNGNSLSGYAEPVGKAKICKFGFDSMQATPCVSELDQTYTVNEPTPTGMPVPIMLYVERNAEQKFQHQTMGKINDYAV